jgi:peptidoglycan hydrolase-like protein with peptidoglycan-binding domain
MSSNGSSGMSQQGVKALQQALKGQGENVKSDGVWGPGTQAALKHYQEQNGLPATGQLDQATRSKLNLQG